MNASLTDPASLRSRRKASISPQQLMFTVSRHFPPIRPTTLSISTVSVPGWLPMNAFQSSYVLPLRHSLSFVPVLRGFSFARGFLYGAWGRLCLFTLTRPLLTYLYIVFSETDTAALSEAMMWCSDCPFPTPLEISSLSVESSSAEMFAPFLDSTSVSR